MQSNLILLAKMQSIGDIGADPATGGLGPFGNFFSHLYGDKGQATGEVLALVVSKIVGVLTVVGGIWFLIQFLIGAFKWITSGGDKTNVEAAKEHLTHAVISLAILVSTYIIAGLVGAIFGLDILNPQNILPKLAP